MPDGPGAVEVASGGMSAIMSSIDTVVQLMGKVWDLLTSNPLLTLLVAASLIPVGISLFTGMRNAARG